MGVLHGAFWRTRADLPYQRSQRAGTLASQLVALTDAGQGEITGDMREFAQAEARKQRFCSWFPKKKPGTRPAGTCIPVGLKKGLVSPARDGTCVPRLIEW